jgi:isoleucyl-tRNA synthetase
MDGVMMALAPILPHMAEDIFQNRVLPSATGPRGSVFEKLWPELDFAKHDEALWSKVRSIRDDANQVMELARADKVIGASMDAVLVLAVPEGDALRGALEGMAAEAAGGNDVDTLRYALMISRIDVVAAEDAVKERCGSYVVEGGVSGYALGVAVAADQGLTKCQRCWFFTDDVGKGGEGCEHDLCARCNGIVKKKGFVVDRTPSEQMA